jgi:hypothetical protein
VSAGPEENRAALVAEIERIAARVAAHGTEAPAAAIARERPPVLEALVEAFALSPFERDVLLLCAGVELNSDLLQLCGGRPTFGTALATLEAPHWSALAPTAPLRRWRLVQLDAGEALVASPLRIDERVLHHLTAIDYADPRIGAQAVPVPAALAPSQLPAADRIAELCLSGVAIVSGADRETRRALVAAGAAGAGMRVHAIAAHELPARPDERETLARLCERETVLSGAILLLEVDEQDDGDVRRRAAALLAAVHGGVIASAREPLHAAGAVPRLELARPGRAEQRALWERALGGGANGTVDRLAGHFDLDGEAIAAISARAGVRPEQLWDACRVHARPALDDLAERIEPRVGWDDLVAGDAQLATLREIAAQVRWRMRVYEDWGLAGRSARGLGVSALFEGVSGTGKTMAAEVLAADLGLDLYRIDLSQVVSKYIGETEKNLARVFAAAESGGAILLFDEADALFGKRSEVRDSHDRYANVEVSYLLTRMESYDGLAILTTNAKDAIDAAFMRRIRFVVRFAFPDEAERAEIWRRAFPEQTPTEDFDPAAIARLNLTGGNIRNVALNAAFLAADEHSGVRMRHIARAALRECAKIERPLPEAEVRAWL